MSVLSPIDLLMLSADEQNILRCLARKPYQIPMAIAQGTGMPLEKVENTLGDLVDNSKIVEQLHEGKRTYSTRFQFRSRQVRNMPSQILDFYKRNEAELLADVPLLASLLTEERQQLNELCTKRTLIPEEVLFWQGDKLDFVAIVENGLLKLTEIRSRGRNQQGEYMRRTDWIGLEETMAEVATQSTCTAVTQSTLLMVPKADFYTFVHQHPQTLIQINAHLSQKLYDCETAKRSGQGKLWVVDGIEPEAGVTTIASSLALIAQKNLNGDGKPHVLFWPHQKSVTAFKTENSKARTVGNATIQPHPAGFDILTQIKRDNYPTNVRLDMLLNSLIKRYEYIICDTGQDEDDFLFGLRGNAHTVITLATAEGQVDVGRARWQKFRHAAAPGQKKILALNKATSQGVQVDPHFHLVIPNDKKGVTQCAKLQYDKIDEDSHFSQAIEEVYRRLSLSHSIAIFVPSTMDVDQDVDNSQQVQTTLSFLGGMFGGATSSDAEGVWRSEDSGLVTEQVTVVRTFVSKKALNSKLDDILGFASQLKKEMKQEAVAVSVDNQMILV